MPLLDTFRRSVIAATVVFFSLSARAEQPSPDVVVVAGGVPSLTKVMELAKEQAPSVAVARAEVRVGQAAYAGARLAPIDNPYLEVFTDRGTQGATKDITVQANLWLPIEISGQRGHRVAAVDALVAWQESNLDAARALATAAAVRAFGNVVVVGARIRTYTGLVSVAKAESDVYQARLEVGDTTERDAKLAKVELARNSISLAESRADLTRALTELNRLTAARFTGPPPGVLEPPASRAASARRAEEIAERAPLVKTLKAEAIFHARDKERAARDAHTPLNLIITLGRGDMGEARFGGGISWTFPVLRRNQAEQAKADASRARALAERDVRVRYIAQTIEGLLLERQQVRRALEELDTVAEPAAQAAVDAAVATQQAGKGELLSVLTARRDLALLKARRLDLIQREWSIVSDIVALTGELP